MRLTRTTIYKIYIYVRERERERAASEQILELRFYRIVEKTYKHVCQKKLRNTTNG